MTIQSIRANTSTASTQTSNAAGANPFGSADGAAFMQLLLAQLKNQNPLEPMQDREFMGQITQLNSLQQLQQMNGTLKALSHSDNLTQAAGLIGKTVKAQAADGKPVSGIVTGVKQERGDVVLMLGDTVVALADVTSVSQ